MPSDLPRLTVRMEQELVNKINKIAQEENRSTNQEIVYAVKKYVEQYEKEHGHVNSAELSISKIG